MSMRRNVSKCFGYERYPWIFPRTLVRGVFCICLMFLWSGCALEVTKEVNQRMVMVDGQGEFVDTMENPQVDKAGTPMGVHNYALRSFMDYKTIPRESYQSHLDGVFAGMEAFRKERVKEGKQPKLLIFVHGGLNTQTTTIERVKESYQQIEKAGYYPIFINWQSSLFSSYRDHLLWVRQGQWRDWGPIISPFYLIGDVLRGVVRAPLTWTFLLKNDLETVWDFGESHYTKKAFAAYHERFPENISEGHDQRTGYEMFVSSLQYVVTVPTKLLIAPLLDAMGTSSWDIMLRRTKTLFHKDEEFESGATDVDTPVTGEGGLSIFLRQFQKAIQENDWEITLIGHSMGTIVITELLRQFPDIPFDNIVFMAGAATIRDYEHGVFPYLQRSDHRATQFYHLVLHEEAEARERWEKFPRVVDLPPRGSLLVWIDNFLSTPKDPLDRTVGRWSNLVVTLGDTPKSVRERIHVKGFSVGLGAPRSDPQEHGDFTNIKKFHYWDPANWKPESH